MSFLAAVSAVFRIIYFFILNVLFPFAFYQGMIISLEMVILNLMTVAFKDVPCTIHCYFPGKKKNFSHLVSAKIVCPWCHQHYHVHYFCEEVISS